MGQSASTIALPTGIVVVVMMMMMMTVLVLLSLLLRGRDLSCDSLARSIGQMTRSLKLLIVMLLRGTVMVLTRGNGDVLESVCGVLSPVLRPVMMQPHHVFRRVEHVCAMIPSTARSTMWDSSCPYHTLFDRVQIDCLRVLQHLGLELVQGIVCL